MANHLETYVLVCTKNRDDSVYEAVAKGQWVGQGGLKGVCNDGYFLKQIDLKNLPTGVGDTVGKLRQELNELKEFKEKIATLEGFAGRLTNIEERVDGLGQSSGVPIQQQPGDRLTSPSFKAEDFIGVFSSGFGIVISFFVLGLVGAVITRFLRTDWFGR